MRFVRVLVPFLFLLITPSSFATYQWGFADMSLNHLDWSSDTESKSTKTDFNYLELEGGAQHSWGELYGFFDIENIDKNGEEMRTAGKGVIRYYLGASHFSLYGHVYNFSAASFNEQNRVFGFGYQFTGKGWWFKPFLGLHDVTQTYFNGANGFMGGWILGYLFKIGDQSFSFTDWHEIEFDRNEDYAFGNGKKSFSQNGAAALWWDVIPQITLGLQWRYATDKLGTAGALNAGIGTLRVNF